MIYVMSDIHGQYKAYLKMLDAISFSEDDTLYILGDVIDRGRCGISILLDVMQRDNVVLLRGNHEQILIDRYSCRPSVVPIDYEHWIYGLGGKNTENAFKRLEPKQRRAVLEYLNATPLQLQVMAEGWKYHLVHGYPDIEGDIEKILWERYEPWDRSPPLPPGTDCIVFGHTPTYYYTGKNYRQPMKIFFDTYTSMIGIDCGCAHQKKPGRLGCLCLDNWQESYIDIWK